MKKLICSALLMATGFVATNNATAAAHQWMEGNTCYVFKQNKLSTKQACQVYRESGANSAYPTYGFENYIAKVPKAGVISVVNSTSCQSENSCKHQHTVNEKKAVTQYRQAKSPYKAITQKQAEKMSQNAIENLLTCDKTVDGKLEICTGKETSYDVPDTFPSWTGYHN